MAGEDGLMQKHKLVRVFGPNLETDGFLRDDCVYFTDPTYPRVTYRWLNPVPDTKGKWVSNIFDMDGIQVEELPEGEI